MEQYTDNELELNEDADVNEDLDPKLNSYEDVEINIDRFKENDVGADDLQLNSNDLLIIPEIPELNFVSDSDISQVTTWQATVYVTEVENKFLRYGKNCFLTSMFPSVWEMRAEKLKVCIFL